MKYDCQLCGTEIDPAKDFYVTVNERKGPSLDFCSMSCAATYVNDEG